MIDKIPVPKIYKRGMKNTYFGDSWGGLGKSLRHEERIDYGAQRMFRLFESLDATRKKIWFAQETDLTKEQEAQIKQFRAAIQALRDKSSCTICAGWGHDDENCPALVHLDASARDNGVSWVWGAIKNAAKADFAPELLS